MVKLRCEFLLKYLSDGLKDVFNMFDPGVLEKVSEIRFHKNGYITLIIVNTTYFFDYNGDLYDMPNSHCLRISKEEFDNLFISLCDFTVHKYTQSLKMGYLVLENGVRIGVCSNAVYENGEVKSVNEVTSLNVRIPRNVTGFSLDIMNKLYKNGCPGIIVAGMPNSGKTTFLRDMAYQLSLGSAGKCRKVCVIDERREICSFESENLFLNTDVLSGFKKADGIETAVRTMSPEIIICDEIANKKEVEKIIYGFSCGASFALSVHVGERKDIFKKAIMKDLISTGEFSYIVFLEQYKYKPEIIDITECKNEICGNDNPFNFNDGNRRFYVI